jgi:radical SAM-linked protein
MRLGVPAMMRTATVQRLRVTYGVTGPLCYVSVLDMGRLWERLLRRAGVPLAYTQGFSPHPRLQFAAALPVGYGSTCELLDILLAEPMEPMAFARASQNQAPAGLTVVQVEEALLADESPQARMRAADYRVLLYLPETREQIVAAMGGLLARTNILRTRLKKGQMATYDLRPLIDDLVYVSATSGGHELFMTLHCGPQGAGRPEEIIDELAWGSVPYTITRTRLTWGEAGAPQISGEEESEP